ncbi:methyltransferase domain-containing protein [Candidatus Falkowbacteria bacterium]|nr:methyltransferase domain-containing protein [Candidatus Falkowbacteria bacterium]
MANKYIFILGKNPALSQAEILAVLPHLKIIRKSDKFLVAESPEIDCQPVLDQLGGTIKIGQVISDKLNKENIIKEIIGHKKESKINFGFSFYQVKPAKIGLEIKSELKNRGISSRLVVSREETLSSVVVTKNKCLEFLVLPDFLGLTGAVQKFEEYGLRDYGRPASDPFAGMLPPKLAKMMLNLSQAEKEDIILDPFCGSGTILTEAAALGYKNLIGSDRSEKAVKDTEENLKWIMEKLNLADVNFKITQVDVRRLSEKIKSADAVVTEPYLGPALRGRPNESEIKKIVFELEKLYFSTFCQFKKILNQDGKIVIIFPEWHIENRVLSLNIFPQIQKQGFKRLDRGNLIYKRSGQKVWRLVTIWGL